MARRRAGQGVDDVRLTDGNRATRALAPPWCLVREKGQAVPVHLIWSPHLRNGRVRIPALYLRAGLEEALGPTVLGEVDWPGKGGGWCQDEKQRKGRRQKNAREPFAASSNCTWCTSAK